MGKCLFMRKGETHTAPSVVKTVTVNVTDEANAVSILLTTVGELTVGGTKIVLESQAVELKTSTALVKYTLTKAISEPRAVVINGTTLGTISASGASVSLDVPIVDGGTITVAFKK